MKGLYEVIKYIIRREYDKIIPKLTLCGKNFGNDETLDILFSKSITLARFHLAQYITKYYQNIPIKDVASIFDLKYVLFHIDKSLMIIKIF